jgi:hypothetical protein
MQGQGEDGRALGQYAKCHVLVLPRRLARSRCQTSLNGPRRGHTPAARNSHPPTERGASPNLHRAFHRSTGARAPLADRREGIDGNRIGQQVPAPLGSSGTASMYRSIMRAPVHGLSLQKKPGRARDSGTYRAPGNDGRAAGMTCRDRTETGALRPFRTDTTTVELSDDQLWIRTRLPIRDRSRPRVAPFGGREGPFTRPSDQDANSGKLGLDCFYLPQPPTSPGAYQDGCPVTSDQLRNVWAGAWPALPQ